MCEKQWRFMKVRRRLCTLSFPADRFTIRLMVNSQSFVRMGAWVAILLLAVPARGEVSKADRLFMKNGLYMHALCFDDHLLHLETLKKCGFTGVTWPFKSNMKQLGPPPGLPWCRWTTSDEEVTVTAEEKPYVSNLVALQLRDEQDLNDPKVLAAAKKWFEETRKRHPDIILYTNQYGGLLTDANMARYIETCKPDMLSFDSYPILETEDNWRSYFGDLQRYRAFSTAAGIPFQSWMQTFNGEDKYRNPSESELRVDIFGAWTFGAKMQTCFTYNAGSSSLFKKTFNGSGDTQAQAGYEWLRQILHESRNLSPHLSKLRCVDAKWILGEKSEYPWGVGPWKFDKEFAQLRGFTVKNLGTKHEGKNGDVALGFFKALEGGDGERWVMVTNALADRTATAKACLQRITLNVFLKEGETIQKVNRGNGKLEPAELKKVGEAGRYLLELDLPGGTGELLLFGNSSKAQ
jgi:hypothetical protein